MTELLVLLTFCTAVVACALSGISVIWALTFGFLLFTGYGLFRGHALRDLLAMAFKGVRTTSTIIIVMGLIGMLTGSWRASGTIAWLVSYAVDFVTPANALPAAFLLNALLSTLTGTSFGTVATMGVITMTLCDAMGINPMLSGGAILAGAFVGDRCSPVSTSAALVAAITKTNLYTNMRLMLKTGAIPFILAVAVYAAFGFFSDAEPADLAVREIFSRALTLSPWTLLPAVQLLTLVFCRVAIRDTMILSIAAAAAVSFFIQNQSAHDIFSTLIFGYAAPDADVARLLNGGGLLSMISVCVIVMISATYAGLFEGTGLLQSIERIIPAAAERITPFGTTVLTALAASAVACNQVLAVMLTNQLTQSIQPNAQHRAIELENTAIVIPPLIPWSIAGAVPIATIGAPTLCIAAAVYLWLLPLWGIFAQKHRAKHLL